MRIAVSQFATSSNVSQNLATCLRMISEAAECKPSIIVLPECCNTQPWYVDHNHAWNDALTIEGNFFLDVAALAKKHSCYILLNVTLRRDLSRDIIGSESALFKSNITITSCLFSPLGKLLHLQDKHNLSKHEQKYFTSTNHTCTTVPTSYGNIGILAGNDTFSYEASRNLALAGSQLICNSINALSLDQSCLHDPTRAFENNVFLVTANKIGPLFTSVGEGSEVLPMTKGVSKEYLLGCGQSQIISPEGKVLAKMNNSDEGFVFADIILEGAGLTNQLRPDGTKTIIQQLPDLYRSLSSTQKREEKSINNIPNTANVAIFATYKSDEEAINDVCHYIENNLSDIIQLPELFFIADKKDTFDENERIKIENLSKQLIAQVSSVLRPFQYLCTSLIIEGSHKAVLISEHGVLATQEQLHHCQRYNWSSIGSDLNTIDLPLEQGSIRLAMLTADDANIPEIVKIAAISEIQVLLVPFDIQEPCEVEFSLLSRAAENRICIIAASREKSFSCSSSLNVGNNKNKIKAQKSTGFIANLSSDLSFLPQWKTQSFNGFINQPLVKHQYGKITKAVIHPVAARSQMNVNGDVK